MATPPTTHDDPQDDKSKHDPDVRHQLFLLRLSHRVGQGLCIICGEVKAMGACDDCKEKQRQKRIREAGYDYYSGIFDSEE